MPQNNNILVEASALYDFDIGIIQAVKDSKHSKGVLATMYDNSTDEINKPVAWMKLFQTFEGTKIDSLLSSCFHPDFYQVFGRGAMYSNALDLYKVCSQKACKTAAVKLVNAYSASDAGISVTVSCRNSMIADIVARDCPKVKIIIAAEAIDLTKGEYSRILVRNLEDLDKYSDISGMNILVQDYRSNFDSDKKTQLLPEYIINYGDANEIEIVNNYVGLERPMG